MKESYCDVFEGLGCLLGEHTIVLDEFTAFFNDKVETVRASTMSTPAYDVSHRSTPTLEKWTLVTTDEVRKLISSSPCKTCQLDPVPTWPAKDIKALPSPFITLLFNSSAAGYFSSEFKQLWSVHN